MYIVTGAAGFIGSCIASDLKKAGHGPLVLVDDFSKAAKAANFAGLKACEFVEREVFFDWFQGKEKDCKAIIHLGARTDTSELDRQLFAALNIGYTWKLWAICVQFQIPFIYASSAATYGGGEFGFEDSHDGIPQLQPLNPYGESKHIFDLYAIRQEKQPPFWAGLKFFNVFGPNEYHKGRMASVVFHAFNQISATGQLKLFRSHKPAYRDGEQIRDFIYVKDLVKVVLFLLEERPASAIYNLGTGKARSFLDLGRAVFSAMGQAENIEFIDTPIDIRDTYQYFTEADMTKLLDAGYEGGFMSLEDAVQDYVSNYLMKGQNY